MASGGSVWLGSKPNIQFTVSYSVTRNLSTVTISLSCSVSGVSGASYYGYPLYGTPTINGSGKSAVTIKGSSPSQWSSFSVSLGTYTTTVSNLAQTSMPVSVYFTGNGKSATLSFSASLPNVSPSTISSSADFVIGNDLPVSISRASGSFTHSINVNVAGTDIGTWNNIGDSTTLPLSEKADQIYALIPNANTAAVTLTLTTYSGSSTIGSTTRSGTASASADACKPTFSGFTVSNSDTALTGDAMTIIPNRSNLTITIGTPATANKSATMASYFATCGNKSASVAYSSGTVTMTLNEVNSNQVSVSAIDSRGNSTEVAKALTVLDYTSPALGSVTFARDNAVEETGKLSYSGKWWNQNFGAQANAIANAQWWYRLTGTESWTQGASVITPTVSGDTFSFSGYITPNSGGWNIDNSYEVMVTITDAIGSGSLTGSINVGVMAIDVRRIGSKYWAGFGKVPDVANMPNGGIDVEGDIFNYGINASDWILETKNKIFLWRENVNETYAGITTTCDFSTNTVTINGTATGNCWFGYTYYVNSNRGIDATQYRGQEMTLSIHPSGQGGKAFLAVYTDTSGNYYDIAGNIEDSYTFTVPNDAVIFRIGIHIPSGTTVNNVAYRLMLQEAKITDDNYLPFAMTNLELTKFANAKVYKQVYDTFASGYAKQWTVHGSGVVIAICNLQTYATTAGGGAGSEECYVNIITNGNTDQLAYVNNAAVSTWGWTGGEAVGFATVSDGQKVQCYSVASRGNITITKRINAVIAFGCTLTDV